VSEAKWARIYNGQKPEGSSATYYKDASGCITPYQDEKGLWSTVAEEDQVEAIRNREELNDLQTRVITAYYCAEGATDTMHNIWVMPCVSLHAL
jgi:hypothetical protein